MSKETKLNCIKENADVVIAGLDAYLDSIYAMTDNYFTYTTENNEIKRVLKDGLKHDEKLEKFILELESDSNDYEILRSKLKKKDFNLSLAEIARAGLACQFLKIQLDKRKNAVLNSLELTKSIITTLMEPVPPVELEENNNNEKSNI